MIALLAAGMAWIVSNKIRSILLKYANNIVFQLVWYYKTIRTTFFLIFVNVGIIKKLLDLTLIPFKFIWLCIAFTIKLASKNANWCLYNPILYFHYSTSSSCCSSVSAPSSKIFSQNFLSLTMFPLLRCYLIAIASKMAYSTHSS